MGGAEKTLFRLATSIDPVRFPVADVVSLKPAGDYLRKLSALGAKTESLELRGRPSFEHVSRLCAVIERERPDVVHALMYQAIQLCRLAKRRLRGKAPFHLITSPRVSYRTRSAFTLLIDKALKGADDLLVAESEATRRHLIESLGYAADRVKVVYNGVDAAPAGLQREQKRRELQLGPEEILLGTVGRLDDQKGHAVLLEAVARLKDSIALRLVILGEGPLRPALEGQIRRLRLECSVRLLGERADVASWLSALDLFVLPSLWEGLPNSLLEAMAVGLPCLATSVDGVPEVILPGQSGLLVPAGDSAALAEAITALAKDPAIRSRLGEAAAKTARERFSLPRMIAEYEATYSEVMSRPIR